MTRLLEPLSAHVQTITSDNGREFARHQQIATKLGADFYFAHLYASWERGLNKNANGLMRQLFSKGSDFTPITQKEVEAVMQRLHHRPRKTLAFETPSSILSPTSVALFP